MKALHIISLILAILGGAIILDSSNVNLASESSPMVRPYPGSGFQIKYSIKVAKNAEYWLEIELPDHLTSEVNLPNKPPLDCDLKIKITSGSVNFESTVKQLEYEGQVPAESVSLYVSDKRWDLKRGEYDVEIASEKTPELILTHGALLRLEQIENPVEPILFNKLLWFGGMLSLILGVGGLILVTIIELKREMGKPNKKDKGLKMGQYN